MAAATPNLETHAQITTRNPGWTVALAGMGINLALGVLYSWSVVSKAIPAEWGWTEAGKSLPYSIACLVFSLVMVPAGSLQDRLGPRLAATIGGILVGAGFIVCSLTTTTLGYIFGFGVLAGSGFGFGYAAATPPAVKWFPAARTGVIAGIVVAGFGFASVYVAPLANWLIGSYGVSTTALILGIAFLIVVVSLARLLTPPPAGYVPPSATPVAAAKAVVRDYTSKEMLRTWQFYLLWFLYACGAGAGLMIISKLAKVVEVQAGLALGFLLVAVLAIGNGSGRVAAGLFSDKFGRKAQLVICFLVQAGLIYALSMASKGSSLASTAALVALSAGIGANYGANLSLFPSLTKDFYGLKHFGVNYGLVFTAWGVGGFSLSLVAGAVYDATKSFSFAYTCSIALLIAAALLTLALKAPKSEPAG
ncbi:MAG: OFA family MFS transporter [Armatimonadetes bacterium]|nr:OFA family MFS transporter [Armatimonadota bacterium]